MTAYAKERNLVNKAVPNEFNESHSPDKYSRDPRLTKDSERSPKLSTANEVIEVKVECC